MSELRQRKIKDLKTRLATAGVICNIGPKTDLRQTFQPTIANDLSSGIFPGHFPTDLIFKPVLNEITPKTHGNISPYGFALMAMRNMITRNTDRFLWCAPTRQTSEDGQLFAPGLSAININPAHIIQLEARRAIDVLWAMEEAARSNTLKAVIGLVDNLTFTQSRRLSLAAAHGQTAIFMLCPHSKIGGQGASTAFSRWQVSSRPSKTNILNARAPGRAAYEVELFQCRDGRKGKWICHYECKNTDKTHHRPVVATSGNTTPYAHKINRQLAQ